MLGFILPCGLYKLLRAPFGLRDVPPKFQKKMDIILADLKGCFSFLDDIIVFGSTKEEHDERLNVVLNRLQSKGLVANFDKCEFEKTNIERLGLKLGLNEFAILENNLTSIAEMKVPYDKQSLASALGLLSHYRKLLPSDYSLKAADFFKLLHKNVAFKWTEGLTEQFKCLQKMLLRAKPLAMYNPLAETIVTCDASKIGIGDELSQLQYNGEYKTVSFFTRSFQEFEKKI